MAKKTSRDENNIPQGAVSLDNPEMPDYEPRTGAERVREVAPGVWVIKSSNRLSKGLAMEGPFVGKCRQTGREFTYYTHTLPDKDGVFAPARYDLHPELLAERIDERQAKLASLPDAVRAFLTEGR